jgi:hypothetical protein
MSPFIFFLIFIFIIIIIILIVLFSIYYTKKQESYIFVYQPNSSSKCILLQTSDAQSDYSNLIDILKPLHLDYCKRFGWTYICNKGVVYGNLPHHSIFNRSFLIQNILEDNLYNENHWLLFLDADAYIKNETKDWNQDLDQWTGYLIVACSKGYDTPPEDYYKINNGVFFVNLRHPLAKKFFKDYTTKIQNQYPLDKLKNIKSWGKKNYISDQSIMYEVLKSPEYKGHILMMTGQNHNYFNYEGENIVHLLRHHWTMEKRMEHVSQVMADRKKIKN